MIYRPAHVAILLSLLLPATAVVTAAERPEKWAKPMTVDGLPNLHQLNDTLYRGAQPTAAGIRALKKMGVKTIINLRSFHSDRGEIGDTGLAYEHIYMKAWYAEQKEVVRFLQIVTDPDRASVFVHCKHGADRTGLMCAIYRVAIEGWSKDDAIAEMTTGGFGYHTIWANLTAFLREIDIEAVTPPKAVRADAD